MKGFLLVCVMSINVCCIYQIEHLITDGLDYYFCPAECPGCQMKGSSCCAAALKEDYGKVFWASCSVCSSPCTRLPWQGRGVSHGFISDKLKGDKLAAFPFLFSFFCLTAIAVSGVGCRQDISGLQRMWGHWTEEMSQVKLTSCMNPFSPQSVPPSTQIWFSLSFIFFSPVEFNT